MQKQNEHSVYGTNYLDILTRHSSFLQSDQRKCHRPGLSNIVLLKSGSVQSKKMVVTITLSL